MSDPQGAEVVEAFAVVPPGEGLQVEGPQDAGPQDDPVREPGVSFVGLQRARVVNPMPLLQADGNNQVSAQPRARVLSGPDDEGAASAPRRGARADVDEGTR